MRSHSAAPVWPWRPACRRLALALWLLLGPVGAGERPVLAAGVGAGTGSPARRVELAPWPATAVGVPPGVVRAQPVPEVIDFGEAGVGEEGGLGPQRPLVSPGMAVTYRTTIFNRGTLTATATLTDTLPLNVAFESASVEFFGAEAPGATCHATARSAAAPSVVTCRVPDVPPGSFRLRVEARVVDCAPSTMIDRVAVAPSRDVGGVAWLTQRRWCVDEYYLPWYDGATEGVDSLISIVNPTTVPAEAEVTIGGVSQGVYPVPGGGSLSQRYPGQAGGPVVVRSRLGARLLVSAQVRGDGWFDELLALTPGDFGPSIVFPWYQAGATIRVGNPESASRRVRATLAGAVIGEADVPGRGMVSLTWPDRSAGPLEIESLDGGELYATQQVSGDGGVAEFAGLAGEQVATEYWLPQAEVPAGTDDAVLVVANPGRPARPGLAAADATVAVVVAGVVRETFVVPVHQTVVRPLLGAGSGPLQVRTSDSGIVASRRLRFQGRPDEVLLTAQRFGYDRLPLLFPHATGPGGEPSVLALANPYPGGTATVEIAVGDAYRATVAVPGQGAVTVALPGLAAGPVTLSSRDTFTASQRVSTADGFEELPGSPVDAQALGPPP